MRRTARSPAAERRSPAPTTATRVGRSLIGSGDEGHGGSAFLCQSLRAACLHDMGRQYWMLFAGRFRPLETVRKVAADQLGGGLAVQARLTRTSESGRCAAFIGGGPFPRPGIAALFLHAVRERSRLTNWPSLRSRRFASIAPRQPDRHPGHPPRPMPGR